jgi:hypothetical protein
LHINGRKRLLHVYLLCFGPVLTRLNLAAGGKSGVVKPLLDMPKHRLPYLDEHGIVVVNSMGEA